MCVCVCVYIPISYVIVISERAREETCGFLAWRSPTAREGTAWIARWKNTMQDRLNSTSLTNA